MKEGFDGIPDPEDWASYQTVSAETLAKDFVEVARNIRLPAFKRHQRGPKKPAPKRTKHTDSLMFQPCGYRYVPGAR